jgi:hypothetical protein
VQEANQQFVHASSATRTPTPAAARAAGCSEHEPLSAGAAASPAEPDWPVPEAEFARLPSAVAATGARAGREVARGAAAVTGVAVAGVAASGAARGAAPGAAAGPKVAMPAWNVLSNKRFCSALWVEGT